MIDEQNETISGKPKLLLADDSITIRKVVELTFAEEGIDVTAVGSGEEAMQKFVEAQPDIVLVDVNMPDPTGYHICEMIKQDESTRHIPVLLLVGSFEPFDQDLAEKVGADGFMVKPFQSIRELVGKVNELLGPEKEPVRTPPETSDIDNLIHDSFSESYKTGDGENTDVFLGDAGLDDEIIETTHPSDRRRLDETAEIETRDYSSYDEPVEHISEIEHIDQPYEFERRDHSFESKADRTPEEEHTDQPFEIERAESEVNVSELQFHGEPVGDASERDTAELPYSETVHEYTDQPTEGEPANTFESEHTYQAPSYEHTDHPSEIEGSEQQGEMEDSESSHPNPTSETEPDLALRGFDWSAAPVDEPAPETPSNGSFDRRSVIDEDRILDLGMDDEMEVDTLRDMELEETPTSEAPKQEPSEEFIARVAALVVEKLSDRVVREIAREAVPRIAENLIREALEEEKNR